MSSSEYKKSVDVKSTGGNNSRRVAEPYLLNYREKLQRIIQKKDENEEKYKELCTRINSRIGRSSERLRITNEFIESKLKVHRRNKTSLAIGKVY